MGIVHNTPLQTHEGNHKIVTMIFTDSNKTLLVFPLNTPVYTLSFYFFINTCAFIDKHHKKVSCSFKCLMKGMLLLKSTLSFNADHNHK